MLAAEVVKTCGFTISPVLTETPELAFDVCRPPNKLVVTAELAEACGAAVEFLGEGAIKVEGVPKRLVLAVVVDAGCETAEEVIDGEAAPTDTDVLVTAPNREVFKAVVEEVC